MHAASARKDRRTCQFAFPATGWQTDSGVIDNNIYNSTGYRTQCAFGTAVLEYSRTSTQLYSGVYYDSGFDSQLAVVHFERTCNEAQSTAAYELHARHESGRRHAGRRPSAWPQARARHVNRS